MPLVRSFTSRGESTMNLKATAVGMLTLGVMSASGIKPVDAAEKSALTPVTIDTAIRTEWKRAGVVPAPPVDDARFLRRLYLDLTGTIPTELAVRAFLADGSPDKRVKAIDSLL